MKPIRVAILTTILIPFILSLMTHAQAHASSTRTMTRIEGYNKTGYEAEDKTSASVRSVELFPYDHVDQFPNNVGYFYMTGIGAVTDTVTGRRVIRAELELLRDGLKMVRNWHLEME